MAAAKRLRSLGQLLAAQVMVALAVLLGLSCRRKESTDTSGTIAEAVFGTARERPAESPADSCRLQAGVYPRRRYRHGSSQRCS